MSNSKLVRGGCDLEIFIRGRPVRSEKKFQKFEISGSSGSVGLKLKSGKVHRYRRTLYGVAFARGL